MIGQQLDLFAEPAPAVIAQHEPEPDALVDRLIEKGMVHNSYLLTLNQALGIPAMDLPSRLFQWPVEFVDRARRKDGESVLLLNHPDLAELPFVDQIEARAGVRPVWEPTDEYGRDRGERYRYFHALDLLTDDHWLDLLRTRNFTDRDGIVVGLKYHAEYGGLSVANTRSVLSEIGEAEPDDKSAAYLDSHCQITEAQQGKFVGFKHDRGSAAQVWATIYGLEAKKFRRDQSGYLRFSKAFLEQKQGATV